MTATPDSTRQPARLRLLLFGLAAVASVGAGFLLPSVAQAQIFIKRAGYFTITFTFAWALFAWWRVLPVWRAEFGRMRRDTARLPLLIIAACVAIAVLTVPFTYKVLYDEMVLQATAFNLHFFREVSTVLRAYTIDGVFMPLDAYLDKRPFFFTYVLSLLHDVTGYREANAFWLNLALMPVILLQVYWCARRLAPRGAALAVLVTFGTLSLLAHNATGAGMEMMNLAMLLLTVQAGIIYLEAPDETRLAALLLSAVLLAQTRYESSLYVFPAGLVALEGWRRAGRPIVPVAAILTPVLLVPYAIHNTYLSGTPLLWELHENQDTRFGWVYVWGNLQHAFTFFFSASRLMTNSVWLSLTGFAALGFGAFRLWRSRRNWREASPAEVVTVVFGGAILANLALLMFYYWGQLDDPIVGRLSLPASVLMMLALASGLAAVRSHLPRASAVVAAGAGLTLVVSGLGANAQHASLNTLDRELLWERQVVAQLAPADRLIITNKSALPWMLCRIPAIALEQARGRVEALRFQLEHRGFGEILVFQNYRPTTAGGDFVLDPAHRLPEWFVLEPIAEKRIGTRIARISRLVEIGTP